MSVREITSFIKAYLKFITRFTHTGAKIFYGIRRYFYSKTNHMHNISNLFYFGTTLYMFQTVSPSIIRSLLASSHRTCMTYT